MAVGIRFTGTPSGGATPSSMLPGNPGAGAATDPIQARIQNEAQANAAWTQMGAPGGVQNILASHAARNQQASSNAMGYNASGLGYSQSGMSAGVTGAGSGSNPFGQYASPQYGSAAYYLRGIFQSGQQTAANTSGIANTMRAGGGAPNVPNFGWGPGGGGPPNVPNFGWGPGGGGPPIVPNFGWSPGGQPPNPPPAYRQPPTPPGGGGGGGMGPGTIPFANMLGVGATSRMITGGVGLGIAGKVIEELAFLPQHLMNLEGSALGNAEPYWSYRTQAAGLSRAGGFAGEGTSKQFYQGIKPPEWMQRLGLGPQQSLDMLQDYGIAPQSAGESQRVVEQLGSMRFMPAYGGLPAGQAEQSAALFSKYGTFADTGAGSPYFDDSTARERGASVMPFTPPSSQISQYNAQMVDIMARAQELGLNRSQVMRSIDSTLQTAVTRGGGVGYTPQSIGNELLRFSSLPGGRTGEVGANMIAAASQFGQGVGSSALPTIAYSGLAERLRSESDIQTYTEKSDPGFLDKMKRNPATAKLLQEYLQARTDGHMPAASQLLSSLLNQSPSLPGRVADEEGAAGSFPAGYQHDVTTANSLGVDPLQVIAGHLPAPKGAGGGMDRSRAEQARAFYISKGWSNAAATGITAYYAEETGGSFNPRSFNPKGGGQGAQGMGQWRGDRIAAFTKMFGHSPLDKTISDDQLFNEQLQFGNWELQNSAAAGGAGPAIFGAATGAEAANIMVDKYGRPGAEDLSKAEHNATAYANRMDNKPDFSGLPEDMLKTQSMGQAGVMAGSQVSATEAAFLIPKLNSAIQAMIDGLAKGQQILTSSTGLQDAIVSGLH